MRAFVIKKKITFSYILEVVEVAASSELVSSIVGVAAPREGFVGPLNSCENL